MSRLTKEREAEALLTFHMVNPVRASELRAEIDALRAELAGRKANCDGRCCDGHLPVEQERQRLAALCVEVQNENRSLRVELAEVHAQSVEASRLSTDLELQLRAELAEARAQNAAIVSQHMNASIEREAAFKALAEAKKTHHDESWRLGAQIEELQHEAVELTNQLTAAKARVSELVDTRRMWVERHAGPCGLVACNAVGSHEHLCGVAAERAAEGSK